MQVLSVFAVANPFPLIQKLSLFASALHLAAATAAVYPPQSLQFAMH